MEKEVIKEYKKGDFTIVWKPRSCIHSGICVKGLPDVYDPKGKPWIKQENASIQELKEQIDKCPSGALTYYMKGENNTDMKKPNTTKTVVKPNGPLLVYGDEITIDIDGNEHKKERIASFCRCGASQNKPFCDGQHNKIGFIG
jgi:uncharacterized Fe-S cluster protein YjdI